MATREALRLLLRGVQGAPPSARSFAGLAGLRARGALASAPSGWSPQVASLRLPTVRTGFGAAAAAPFSSSPLGPHGLATKGGSSLSALDAAAGLPGLSARKPRFYRGGAHSKGHHRSRFADPHGEGAGGHGSASAGASGSGAPLLPQRYSTEPSKDEGAAPPPPPEKESRASMVTRYGVTFMLWWGALYAVPLAGIYAALSTGAIGGADAIQILKHVGLDKVGIDITTINPTFGNLALSYGINEALEIARLPIAVATTPLVAKVFGKKPKSAAAAAEGSSGGDDGDGKPVGKLAMEAKTNKKMEMIKQYGLLFLAWWTVLWGGVWAGLYVALDQGAFGGASGMDIISQVPYVEHLIDLKEAEGYLSGTYGNVGVSFVLTEILSVAIFPVSMATTPAVARLLGWKKKA
mmetsp:Transcript_40026/g.85497  ORF Transcript_40026/g.85497 Transcript_40026/m.85497 type:complete len:408 (+) Transcript_40026:15-1238(+)